MKSIAVLMTCYNRVGTTLECLRRLFAQELPEGYSFDVWLVDDASPDKTGEKVKAAYPTVNVIQGTGKLFWCKGMRRAWDKAAEAHGYDFYLWLNDDVRLDADCLNKLICAYEQIDVLSVICGSLLDPQSGKIFYGARNASFEDGKKVILLERGMHGNVVLVSKEVFSQIGGMASGLIHQHGDFEYGHRARKHGIKVYATAPVGTCVSNYGFDKRLLLTMPIAQRFSRLFSPKHIGLLDYCRYKILIGKFWGGVASFFKGLLLAVSPRLFVKGERKI